MSVTQLENNTTGQFSINGKTVSYQLYEGEVVQIDRMAIGKSANDDGSSTDGSMRLTVRNNNEDRYIPKYHDLEVSIGQNLVAAYIGKIKIPYMLYNKNTKSWYSYGSRKPMREEGTEGYISEFRTSVFEELGEYGKNLGMLGGNLIRLISGVVLIGSIIALFVANQDGFTNLAIMAGSFIAFCYSIKAEMNTESYMKSLDEAMTSHMKGLIPVNE